ncbi:uncharacterized protein J3R85_016536 [Psidium guajava]|nr:uncharacterized protein J3R85_016536 [Psidium guajava]
MVRLRRHHRRCHRRRREDEGAEQEATPTTPPSRPHFFKIILSHTLESGKLGIPKSFLRRHGKDLSGLVLLKVAGGSTWPVKLEKSDNDVVWLWRGWREFMEHYSIGHGYFVVFKYEGDSTFHVIIFDKSASEINYPLSIQTHAAASPEGDFVSRREKNAVEIEDLEGLVPRPWPSSNGSSGEFGGPRSLSALELASEFESDYPFFKLVMRPAYVRNYLGIPCKFFRKHVQKNKQVATLRKSERSWQVKLRIYERRGMAFLSTGWSSFVRETGLCVRDVCLFELIDRDDIVFRVSIFTSHDWIEIERSQCRERSLEPAFHGTPCLSPVSAHEKAMGFESDHPFFKVVMRPSYVWNKLAVPCEFFRKHVQTNRQVATLRYSDRLWQVKLRSNEHQGMACLSAGWPSFVRETGLRVRDVCVFELIHRDDMVFKVSIFTSDGLSPVSAHEKARGFESDHPFFKVGMRPSYVRKYLGIPWEFFRKHVQKNKQVATLRYSDRSWQVKLRIYEHKGAAFLSAGWSSFARETGLRLRDVGVFELTDRDDTVFRVSIFRNDGRIAIEQSPCRESSSEPAFHGSPPCLSPVTAREKASKFQSENPFFRVVILPNRINSKLNIPWEFIKTYIQDGQRTATLISSGRSWEVKLLRYRRFHIACLAAGWPAFAREARLRKGDVCMFELVNRDNIMFRVSIFRNGSGRAICID